MGFQIVKDGQVIHDDNKTEDQKKIEQQEKLIQDLQNQIKDLKKTLNK